MQQNFQFAVKAWKSLDLTGRTNWETWAGTNPQYAKHNPDVELTGFPCFVKWHAITALYMKVVQPNPGLTIQPIAPISLAAQVDTGVLKLIITCPDGVEAWQLYFFASRPLGTSQNFIGTKPKFVGTDTDITGELDITAAYLAHYGTLPGEDSRIAVEYIRAQEIGGEVQARVTEVLDVTYI
jgi:hypothetical protein